jgi:hypothetical protein
VTIGTSASNSNDEGDKLPIIVDPENWTTS